jgi:hypothetical protein
VLCLYVSCMYTLREQNFPEFCISDVAPINR